jgi:cytochrome c
MRLGYFKLAALLGCALLAISGCSKNDTGGKSAADNVEYLNADQVADVMVGELGPSGWGQCTVGWTGTTAYIVRGEITDPNIIYATEKVGEVLGAVRQRLLSQGIPDHVLEKHIEAAALQIRYSNDPSLAVLQTHNACMERVAEVGMRRRTSPVESASVESSSAVDQTQGSPDSDHLDDRLGGAESTTALLQPATLETRPNFVDFTGDAAKGKRVFAQCMLCHTVQEGRNTVGPSLYGIVGRVSGSVPDFEYSGANWSSNVAWTEENLFVYLEKPSEFIPGTIKDFSGLQNPQDRADVIAYLKSHTDTSGLTRDVQVVRGPTPNWPAPQQWSTRFVSPAVSR